jgi:hypothetical protein
MYLRELCSQNGWQAPVPWGRTDPGNGWEKTPVRTHPAQEETLINGNKFTEGWSMDLFPDTSFIIPLIIETDTTQKALTSPQHFPVPAPRVTARTHGISGYTKYLLKGTIPIIGKMMTATKINFSEDAVHKFIRIIA